MFEALFHIVSIPKPTLPKTSCYKATEEHLLHLQRWGPGGAPTLRPMPVISTSCKPWGISTWVSIGVQCIAMHHLDMDSNMINDADIRKRGWGHCNWPVFQFHENMQKHIQCSAFLKYQRSNVVKSCKIMQVFGQKAWGPARRSWSHLIRTPSLDSMTETDPGYEESNQSGKSGISLFGLERSYQQKSIAQPALMPTPGTIFSAMYKAVWALVVSIWRKMLHIKDLHCSTIQGLSCLNREQT